MKTYFINWYGPYNLDDIYKNIPGDIGVYGNGLYMFTGKLRYQRGEPTLQYIGITEQKYLYRFRAHHKFYEIKRSPSIWLGQLAHIEKQTRNDLELVESMLIYFCDQTLIAVRKTSTPPKENCSVFSRYFTREGTRRERQKRLFHLLPDVMSWEKDEDVLYYSYRLQQYIPN